MIFQQIKVGNMENFAYIIGDSKTKEAAIVDPGWDADVLMDFCSKNNLNIKKIILTHTHYDHINDVDFVFKKTNADVYVHSLEAEAIKKINNIHENQRFSGSSKIGDFRETGNVPHFPVHQKSKGFFSEIKIVELNNGDKINVGNIEIKILHTPGHTPGSICLLFNNKLITGDTLFVGAVGRTDLPGGDARVMSESLKRLKKLDDDIEVYPGHDYGDVQVSNIGREKGSNPYFNLGN